MDYRLVAQSEAEQRAELSTAARNSGQRPVLRHRRLRLRRAHAVGCRLVGPVSAAVRAPRRGGGRRRGSWPSAWTCRPAPGWCRGCRSDRDGRDRRWRSDGWIRRTARRVLDGSDQPLGEFLELPVVLGTRHHHELVSPVTGHEVAARRTDCRRRCPSMRSNSSPTACPNSSLIGLNPSRFRNITAVNGSSRQRSSRRHKASRFGRSVRRSTGSELVENRLGGTQLADVVARHDQSADRGVVDQVHDAEFERHRRPSVAMDHLDLDLGRTGAPLGGVERRASRLRTEPDGRGRRRSRRGAGPRPTPGRDREGV